MNRFLQVVFLMLVFAGCQKNSETVEPLLIVPSKETIDQSGLLRTMHAVYTSLTSEGKPRVVDRYVTFNFVAGCQPSERLESYVEDLTTYMTTKTLYFYDSKGLLQEEAKYESVFPLPERQIERRIFSYDSKQRLVSIFAESWRYLYTNNTIKYEYIDTKNQVNQYQCGKDLMNCTLQLTYTNGERTPPLLSPNDDVYKESSFNAYGGTNTSTYSREGNLLSQEVSAPFGEKWISQRVTYEYDNKNIPAITIPDTYFNGFPQLKQPIKRTQNNRVKSTDLTFDKDGKVTLHLEGITAYKYNKEGYPIEMEYRETNKTLDRETGRQTFITFTYGCK